MMKWQKDNISCLQQSLFPGVAEEPCTTCNLTMTMRVE